MECVRSDDAVSCLSAVVVIQASALQEVPVSTIGAKTLQCWQRKQPMTRLEMAAPFL